MRVLIDTNVLARLAHKSHPHTLQAQAALEKLWSEGHELRIVPQVLYEYWSVATRSVTENGLGFPAELVADDVERFRTLFSALRDERGVFERWQKIVSDYGVLGKQSHDARLVAAMQRHGLTHLLTFNLADFRLFPEIALLDPAAFCAR